MFEHASRLRSTTHRGADERCRQRASLSHAVRRFACVAACTVCMRKVATRAATGWEGRQSNGDELDCAGPYLLHGSSP
eukprot:316387-Prymnesium_polylepis.2